MIFADRLEAGERLAKALVHHAGTSCVVLAIPRGGVIVGEVVARSLGAPLDVVVPRKIGAPGNPELAIGAVAPGVRVLDPAALSFLRVSEGYLEREIAAQEEEIERRQHAYRDGRAPQPVAGRIAIVVDDGVATGSTAVAALRWARAQGAARVVLAVPVAPPQAMSRLRSESDEVVVLETPELDKLAGTLTAIDPGSGEPTAAAVLPGNLDEVAVGGGWVGILDQSVGTVTLVDPTTLTVEATVRAGDDERGIAFGADALWLADGNAGTVSRIDPLTRDLEPFPMGGPVANVAVDPGTREVWVLLAEDEM